MTITFSWRFLLPAVQLEDMNMSLTLAAVHLRSRAFSTMHSCSTWSWGEQRQGTDTGCLCSPRTVTPTFRGSAAPHSILVCEILLG